MESNATLLHALHLSLGGEPLKLLHALKEYGTAESAWEAEGNKSLDPEAEFKKLEREGVEVLGKGNPGYPPLLQEIHDAPALLYVKGSLEGLNGAWTIGIVGTRKPSDYGIAVATRLAEDLGKAGASIISGLAVGIDAAAHLAALRAGAATVAVIGSGLDRNSFFPMGNWGISEKIIASGGAVVSEYPPGTPGLPHHFPERNRIIAGLSQGLVVVEAPEKSGALITARLALEENRDVFAVPGSIFSPVSRGPNRLIQEGAIPALGAEDIVRFYGREAEKSSLIPDLGSDEAELLALLEDAMSLEELKAESSLEVGKILALLSSLELKGLIQEIETGRYRKI